MISIKQHHYCHHSNTALLAAIVKSHCSFKRRSRVRVYYSELRHRSITTASLSVIPVTVMTRSELTKNVTKGPLFYIDIFLTSFNTLHPCQASFSVVLFKAFLCVALLLPYAFQSSGSLYTGPFTCFRICPTNSVSL
jgi:hypothetical protein